MTKHINSELFEAADLLEQLGIMLKDDPKEIVNIAESSDVHRQFIADYFIHLAKTLRKEGDCGTKNGQR